MNENNKNALGLPNQANVSKAMFAYIIDFLICFGIMLICNIALAPRIADSFGLQKEIDTIASFTERSGIAHTSREDGGFQADVYYYGSDASNVDEEGKIKKAYDGNDEIYVGLYPYQAYSDIVFSLYSNFYYGNEDAVILTLDGQEKAKTEFADKAAYLKFVGEEVFQIKGDESSLYRFVLDDSSNIDYSKKPVLNENNETVKNLEVADKKKEAVDALNTFWVGSSINNVGAGIYGKAFVAFFNAQPTYQESLQRANHCIYLSRLIFRLIPPVIFIFLLPLLIPEGRSIGRLAAKTKVVSKDGSKAPKWRILIHQSVLLAFFASAFIVSDTLFYAVLLLLPFIDGGVMMASKDNRSIHEKLAGTTTIELEPKPKKYGEPLPPKSEEPVSEDSPKE